MRFSPASFSRAVMAPGFRSRHPSPAAQVPFRRNRPRRPQGRRPAGAQNDPARRAGSGRQGPAELQSRRPHEDPTRRRPPRARGDFEPAAARPPRPRGAGGGHRRRGLEAASSAVPDLVLIDLNLPDMSGYDIAPAAAPQPQLRPHRAGGGHRLRLRGGRAVYASRGGARCPLPQADGLRRCSTS